MEDPTGFEKLCARILLRSVTGFGPVMSFWEICDLGLPMAIDEKTKQWEGAAASFAHDPEYRQFLRDPESWTLEEEGRVLVENMMEHARAEFGASRDSAALVFSHSILDSIAFDCCKISSLVAPEDWEAQVGKRKVVLSEVKGQDYGQLLRARIEEYLVQLERESLLKKIDTLHKKCWQETEITGYAFDSVRLKELDDLRHEVVHGLTGPKELPRGLDDIDYLQKTSLHLATSVLRKYNLTFPQEYVANPKLVLPD